MKITIFDAEGAMGGGIVETFSSIVLEVEEGSTIGDVWKDGKIGIGLTPFKDPTINRYELKRDGETKVVIEETPLQGGDTLYLTFVGWKDRMTNRK